MLKKMFILTAILLVSLVLHSPVFAEDTPIVIPQPVPQSVIYASYQTCIRQYQLPFDKLYYLALASVNYNKFEVLEMQSRNGYILFETGDKEFLLSVMMNDKNKKVTFIKLTPADNSYAFPITIPQKIFSYIDSNLNTPVQEIK